MNAVEIICAAQAILGRYLPPDGITADQAMNELLELLDGPDAVALTLKDTPRDTLTSAAVEIANAD